MASFVEEVKPWVLAGTHPRFSGAWRFTRTGFDGATLATEVLANDKDLLRLSVGVDGSAHTMTQIRDYEALCPCCGYGATRRIGSNGLESRSLLDAASSLFSPDATLINAVEWLLQADYAARGTNSDSRAARHRDAVKNALIGLLPDVEDIRVAGLEEIPPRPRIDVRTPYGVVSLRDLSVGYQTMIAWVVDLASRMFEAYPDSENPLAEAAVALVDEIDLHLHPRWQREITSYLDALFPNVQFIVTAHSPLVVQAPGVTNVAVLRRNGDHVEILNDPEEVRGWRVDQILTSDLFGLDSARAVDVERLLTRHQALVLLDDPTDAERRELRELEERLAELPAGEVARDREACFCESKISHIAFGDVEHFRPKAACRASAEAPERKPGYYWLAHEWSNLYFACEQCNRRHKRNLFPLEDESARVLSHHRAAQLAAERPLYIDPGGEGEDDPEKHITFRKEYAKEANGSRRGLTTREDLGLNRGPLCSRRRDRRALLLTLLRNVRSWLALGCQAAHRALTTENLGRVLASMRDEAEYTAMSRALLREVIPWREVSPATSATDLLDQLEDDAVAGRWLAIPPY